MIYISDDAPNLNPDDATGVYIVEKQTQKVTFLKIDNKGFITLSELQQWAESARQAYSKRKPKK